MNANGVANKDTGPLPLGAIFIGKYKIVALLGQGGQASVYQATHVVDGRELAIKVIQGMTHDMLIRGQAEAKALGKLDHANVVRMLDSGLTQNFFYIIMELLRGRSLRATLVEHPRLEIEEVLDLGIQIGEAVQHAHERAMIHRDLKPENIFLLQGNRLKVLDFGVAKLLDEVGFTTKKDVVLGSLLYMSPEQVQGLPLTLRSDICSLGLILYEALLGKHPTHLVFELGLYNRGEPYRKPTLADIPLLQISEIYPMLSDLDPNIPIYLAQAIMRAIAKVAEQRFSTMADFVEVLRKCLQLYVEGVGATSSRAKRRDLSLPSGPAYDAKQVPVIVTEVIKPAPPPAPQTSAEFSRPAVAPQRAAEPKPTVAEPRAPTPAPSPTSPGSSPHMQAKAAYSSASKQVTAPPVSVGLRAQSSPVKQEPSKRRVVVWAAIVGGGIVGATVGVLGGLKYLPQAKAEAQLSTAHVRSFASAELPPSSPAAPAVLAEQAIAIPLPPQNSMEPSTVPPSATAPPSAAHAIVKARPLALPKAPTASMPSAKEAQEPQLNLHTKHKGAIY